MKDDTIGLVKFRTLKRVLSLRDWEVVGLLESLLLFARKRARDLAVGRYSNADIASCIEWHGDEDCLIEGLVEAGWLTPVDDDRRLILVPWRNATSRRAHRRFIRKSVRRLVMIRDGGICRYCGKSASALDHLIPHSRGGGETPENLVACCKRCNSRKGGRTPEEAGMVLTEAER